MPFTMLRGARLAWALCITTACACSSGSHAPIDASTDSALGDGSIADGSIGDAAPPTDLDAPVDLAPDHADAATPDAGLIAVAAGNMVAAGLSHSGAIIDGGVYLWGGGEARPAALALGSAPIASLAFSSSSTRMDALDAEGRVWEWDGSREPRVVAELPGAVQLACGAGHCLALLGDGTLRAWGANGAGQLGLGTTATVDEPTALPRPTGVVSVCVGTNHSAAVTADGVVWAWGANDDAQLGEGAVDRAAHATPAPVEPLDPAVEVACGRGHTLARLGDGGVAAWGLGTSGQIGDGTGTTAVVPVRLALADVRHVVAAGNSSWAIVEEQSGDGGPSQGRLWAWGQNSWGQLGVGTSAGKNSPTRVKALADVDAVSGGGLHAVFRGADGRVWAAGSNGSGQLGRDGGSSFLPVEVTLP